MTAKTTPKPRARDRAAVEAEPSPRLPHERDESSDGGTGPTRKVMRRAGRDLAAGRVDTTRGTEADAAYRRQKDPSGRHNRDP